MNARVAPELRFAAAVVVSDSGCWLWTGCVNGTGYGTICVHGKRTLAHRFSFEMHRWVIPEGKSILHTCDVRRCVNPEHLFLGTQKENLLDAQKKGRFYKQPEDTCKHGHPATEENVYYSNGHRYCLLCKRESRRRVKETRASP